MGTSLGTVYKLNVNIELPGSLTMDDVDFTCEFFVWRETVEVKKDDMIRLDESNYIAVLDSRLIGRGEINNRTTVMIPDNDIEGGFRTEVYTEETSIKIE